VDILSRQDAAFATTVSSDGQIHLYDLIAATDVSNVTEPLNAAPIAVYDTKGSRLTCVTITETEEDRTEPKKRKFRAESDEEDSDEDINNGTEGDN
jgi:protein MAK11